MRGPMDVKTYRINIHDIQCLIQEWHEIRKYTL